MDFSDIIADIKTHKLAARRYQKSGGRFRDLLTVRMDGQLYFQRFNYGEAAGLVCELFAKSADADGLIAWGWDACEYSKKEQAAPHKLIGTSGASLLFDDGKNEWIPEQDQKKAPGISRFKAMFSK